jgi:hypothetical protein
MTCFIRVGGVALVVLASAVQAQIPGLQGLPLILNPDGSTIPAPVFPNSNVVCDVRGNPLTVRVEGLAELLGDIVIECRGNLRPNPRNIPGNPAGVPPAPVPVVDTINISATLSVPVTSRLVADPLTEALLLIDDPDVPTVGPVANPSEQNPCTGASGVCTGLGAHDGRNDPVLGIPGPVTDGLAGHVTVITFGALGAQFALGAPVNVFQGRRQNNQTITFAGIPISTYDTRGNPRLLAAFNAIRAANGGFYRGEPIIAPWQKTFRIKNLRGAIAGAAASGTQIFSFISIQNPSGNLQLNAATATIGFAQPGLNFGLRNTADSGGPAAAAVNLASCVTVNRDLAVDVADSDPWNGGNLAAQFSEAYQVAFKPRGYNPGQPRSADQFRPAVNYETESGFYNGVWAGLPNGLGLAGLADHGTRLRIVLNNIPANVRVFVSVAGVNGTSPTLGAYAVADNVIPTTPLFPTASPGVTAVIGGAAIPALAFVAPGSSNGITNVQLQSGRGVAVWEVYESARALLEKINFLIAVAYRAGSPGPGLGTATIQGTFAPINTTASAQPPGVPIPRFVETGSPLTAFTIAPCLTNLLFPFVTNQGTMNTGIAISNTSLTNPGTGELFALDPNIGVAPQSGTCTMNYFGTTGADGAAPPPSTTGVIPAGRTFTMTLASGSAGPFGSVPPATNFQGYVIAQCAFSFAHGYAFISDLNASKLSIGYVALIMDAALGSRTGNASEVLGH